MLDKITNGRIKHIKYDYAKQELEFLLGDKTKRVYKSVPKEVYKKIMDSVGKGEYLCNLIDDDLKDFGIFENYEKR